MLSIGAMGNGQGTYYVGLAQEDYYLEGGEPPGRWIGEGAERLGLTGQVERESFLQLFQGFDANGEKLVQNAGRDNRQPGWDLTFSAPKSVSLLWALSSEETRAAIAEAHFAAVKEATTFIEDGAITRRGKDGVDKEKAQLVIATFEHGTSRAQDPQLHTHALVLNVAVREDGTKGAIESKPMYQAKMIAGALYRAELSHRLEAMGLTIEKTGNTFEIKGVPEPLMKETSKRREEIKTALESRGEEGARASAFVALATREVKTHLAREALFTVWREIGQTFGFGEKEVKALHQPREERDVRLSLREAMDEATSRLTQDKSHFSERDLLRVTAEEGQGRGLWASLIRTGVAHEIASNQEIVYLGENHGERQYTTRDLLETEKKLFSDVSEMGQGRRHGVNERTLREAIQKIEREETRKAQEKDPTANRREMNKEQREALAHITQREGSIAVVSGMAGTGKTFLLSAAREAWEESGYKVIGAAVAGKAARGVEEGAGIESVTLAKLFKELDRGFDYEPSTTRKVVTEFKYATGQIDGDARKKLLGTYHEPTNPVHHEWKYATHQISKDQRDFLNERVEREKLNLNPKTVVVIDEAGMVGTAQMAKLVALVKEAGAKLVLVGDARQLQPVEVGGPFRAIEERIGSAKLTEIVRQELDKNDKNPTWRREAVKEFAAGNAAPALKAYQERGFLSISESREEAMNSLITAWKTKESGKPNENLIFAGTREEAKALNRLAQASREAAKELGFRTVRLNGETIHEKDRILITRTDQALNVDNGDLGTVKRIDQKTGRLIVKLDDTREVAIPYQDFQHFQLGYAITTHKGQGATVKNAFILCGGSMADREMSYVQASRAKQETHFFTERLTVWNPTSQCREDRTFEELTRSMSQSRQKDMAHDLIAINTIENRANCELQLRSR